MRKTERVGGTRQRKVEKKTSVILKWNFFHHEPNLQMQPAEEVNTHTHALATFGNSNCLHTQSVQTTLNA